MSSNNLSIVNINKLNYDLPYGVFVCSELKMNISIYKEGGDLNCKS
ncbi:hypothetical protein KJ830_07910 [bacterium]|nr:hypothetical protein [bacterium]